MAVDGDAWSRGRREFQIVRQAEDGRDESAVGDEPQPFEFMDLAGSDGESSTGKFVHWRQDIAWVTIELGRVRLPRERLASLDGGDVVSMDIDAGQPVAVIVNGRLIARGHLVTIDGKIAVRVTERLEDEVEPGRRKAA